MFVFCSAQSVWRKTRRNRTTTELRAGKARKMPMTEGPTPLDRYVTYVVLSR
jgi:hypothetical protein